MAYDKVIDSAALDADLTEIADAIRSKTGSTEKFTLDQMAAEIAGIDTVHNQNKTITANGQYTADSGYTGLGTVTVAVPEEEPVLQDKQITANGQYTADSGYTGLGTVTVTVPEEEPVLQDKQITANGTYQADAGYDGLGEVVVDVPSGAPVIQPLSVTENGTYEAPAGVDGYSPVTVNVASGEGNTILGRPFLAGSFTLAEDMTDWNSYEVISDITKVGFDTSNYVALLFRNRNTRTDESGLWCSVSQSIQYGNNITTKTICISSSSKTATNCGLRTSATRLVVTFAPDHYGYAGETYHWLLTKQY